MFRASVTWRLHGEVASDKKGEWEERVGVGWVDNQVQPER